MAEKIVRFKAIQTIKKPVTVKFKTKDGETVSFKAIQTIKKPVTVSFPAKRQK